MYVYRTVFPWYEDCKVIGNSSKILKLVICHNFTYVKLSIACRKQTYTFDKKYPIFCYTMTLHSICVKFNEVFGAHASFDL